MRKTSINYLKNNQISAGNQDINNQETIKIRWINEWLENNQQHNKK